MAQKKASTEKKKKWCSVCALVIKSVRQNPSFAAVVVVVEVVVVDSGYY